jgi:DNA gyrase subunit A
VAEVSHVGRNTQGVTLIRTAEDEQVVGLQRIEEIEESEFSEEEGSEIVNEGSEVPEASSEAPETSSEGDTEE